MLVLMKTYYFYFKHDKFASTGKSSLQNKHNTRLPLPQRANRLWPLLLLLCWALPKLALGQAIGRFPFSFTLNSDATTSAGIFSQNGTLIRTLWSAVKYQAGPHAASWDGINDDGQLTANGSYIVKVVSNNVKYEWEGVIGNTSTAKSGSSVHHSGEHITNMVVVGGYAYYAVGYNEGGSSWLKFNLNTPGTKINIHQKDGQTVRFVASDGIRVYWGGQWRDDGGMVAASKVSDDSDYTFANGTLVKTNHYNYTSSIDVVSGGDLITGLAVQKTGNYLFATHAQSGTIKIFDKVSGVLVRTITIADPHEIVLQNDATLWLIHGTTVEKYTVNPNGTLTSTGLTLRGVVEPIALSVSLNTSTLIVADGARVQPIASTAHQVKAFNTATGAASWILGQAGGYAMDPTVANDKFYFSDTKVFAENYVNKYGAARPYLCFQPDGSFWVGDVGNLRSQHFSANRTYINQIAYLGYFYSAVVDSNDPTRVFANYLEFAVDYSKPLDPANGSWRLVKNWSAGRIAIYDNPFSRLQCVTTLNNGRTYALALHLAGNIYKLQVLELPPTGNIRYTGVETPSNLYQLFADGSLWNIGTNLIGQPAVWKKQLLTGFDSSNNPQWGTMSIVASTPPLTTTDPVSRGGYLRRGQVTSTGVVVAFSKDKSTGSWHLGGVQAGATNWLWKTSPSTGTGYQGDFPPDGSYDIANMVQNAGSWAQALERNIFWGYNGEFWKNSQTNKWNHYLDNGLFIGQFGTTGPEAKLVGEAAPQYAGNAVSGTVVKVGSDYYLYHCDEFQHGGIHRWKISGLASIQEQTVATLTMAATHGVLTEYFTGADLNNVNRVSSSVTTTVQSSSPANSARWTGFIEPLYSQSYTFYTVVTKKVRLWVDGKMIVNQWNNNSQSQFTSTSLALEAGKRYSIKMEISGNTASLLWSSTSQSQQAVPTASLYAPSSVVALAGINLTEGLWVNSTIENGLYGWSRNATTDYGQDNVYGNKWRMRTNVRSMKNVAPDVSIILQPSVTGITASASRNMSNGTTTFGSWTLTGKMTYPANNDYDKAGDAGYFQVLDENNKVIVRIDRRQIAWPSDFRMYFNNKVVYQGTFSTVTAVDGKAQPIRLVATSSGLTLQYANYPAVTATPFDLTSNWRHPKTLQILFYSPTQAEHMLNLSDMLFISSMNSTPPPLTMWANNTQDILTASHSLGASEIVMSVNDAAFIPYPGLISVGNVTRAAGYWKFKVKAASGRNESTVVESSAFTSRAYIAAVPFTVYNETSQVKSSWKSDQMDVQSFIVERSIDGTAFKAIGSVPSRDTTLDNLQYYHFVDKAPLAGTSYYRLKVVDTAGLYIYSSAVSLLRPTTTITLYPNPAQETLYVQYPKSIDGYLEIMSITGQKITTLAVATGSISTSINVCSLPHGLYWLRYYNNSSIIIRTFMMK